MRDADLIVRGRILTMDTRKPTAQALAIGGGRILAVGTEAQADRWRGRRTRTWSVPPGPVVVPGFVDSHAHLASDAWRRTWVDLSGSVSLEHAIDRLRARAAKTPAGEWIVGRGYDESIWPVKRYLTREDLDRVSRDLPILVNRVDGHMCSVNSVALERAMVTSGDPGVERGPDGTPTGVLKEEAADRARDAVPRPGLEAWARLLEQAIAHAHSLGITSVHDIVDTVHLRAYQVLRGRRKLAIRAYLMPYHELLDGLLVSGLRTGFGDEWLRLGAIKVFADGSLGARTAALSEPYSDDPGGTGRLIHAPGDLTRLVASAHAAGFQLAVHAIGDRAVDAVADAFAEVLEREPREDHRHRIEHFELVSEDTLDRVADLGLVASMQPNFVARWSHPGGMYERRLGRERLRSNNPYRAILRRTIALAFGSDGMPYGPLFGMGGAVEAPFESQAIDANEALRCYTFGGAFSSFEEAEKGTLAAGKLADFVVLSGDPRRSRVDGLAVDATVVGGRLVHRRSRG